MGNETSNSYKICPACSKSLIIYSGMRPEYAFVLKEFEQLTLPDKIEHPDWSGVDLASSADQTLRSTGLRIYLSKLESFARKNSLVLPVDLLPSLDRHPLVCSAFTIPGTMFSLGLSMVENRSKNTAPFCEVSLSGIKTRDGVVENKYNLATIARFSLWGKVPAHL